MLIRFQQCALFALICFAMHSTVHAQFGIKNPLKGIGNNLSGGINNTFKGAGEIITGSIKAAPSAIIPGMQIPDRIMQGRGYGLNPGFRVPNPVLPNPVLPNPVIPSPGYGGSSGGIIDQLPHNLGQVIQNPGAIINPGMPSQPFQGQVQNGLTFPQPQQSIPSQGGVVQQPFQGQVQNPSNFPQPQQSIPSQGGVVQQQFQGQIQNPQPQQVIRSQPIRRVFRNFRR